MARFYHKQGIFTALAFGERRGDPVAWWCCHY
jgi:hypothetical protein